MTRQEEQKPEQGEGELKLEPETVVDLEPSREDAEDIVGGGLGTRCTRGSIVQRL